MNSVNPKKFAEHARRRRTNSERILTHADEFKVCCACPYLFSVLLSVQFASHTDGSTRPAIQFWPLDGGEF
jgi:hypothetical protein